MPFLVPCHISTGILGKIWNRRLCAVSESYDTVYEVHTPVRVHNPFDVAVGAEGRGRGYR